MTPEDDRIRQAVSALDKDEQINSLARQIGDQASMHARVVSQMDAALSLHRQMIDGLQREVAERDKRIAALETPDVPPYVPPEVSELANLGFGSVATDSPTELPPGD